MSVPAFLLAASLMGILSVPAVGVRDEATVLVLAGGPPRISLVGKAGGDITAAQWDALKTVDLQGCVPDARITALTLCIKDCTGRDADAKGTDATLTPSMKRMISNLPAGTPFTVKVVVKDAKGKAWEVPDAKYVWRG